MAGDVSEKEDNRILSPNSVTEFGAMVDGGAGHGMVLKAACDAIKDAKGFSGDTSWTDYEIRADVRMESALVWAGVCFRVQFMNAALHGGRFYQCYLHPRPDLGPNRADFGIGLCEWSGTSWQWYAPEGWKVTVLNVAINEWHTIKLVVAGNQFQCYLDSSLRITVNDQIHASGKIGLRVHGGNASFDNLLVVDRR